MTDKVIQELKIRRALLQVEQSQLRARYYEQRITTGVWKERVGKVTYLGGEPLPEGEVLRGEVATMERHIQIAQELLEFAGSLIGD